jgi:hypothetical protein
MIMFRRYRLLAPDNGSNPSSDGSATQTSDTSETDTSETGETPETTKTPASVDDALKEINDLKSALKKARSDSTKHWSRAKELEEFKSKFDADKLTETERWQKQATDLQSKYDSDTSALTERIVGYEVKLQASKLGIIDPDAASQLLNWDALEYDDDGMPTNVEDLLKDLLKRKSYLGPKGASSAGGATNPSRAASNASGELSWDVITKMTQEQYNARRAEIQQWMMRNPMRRI